MTGVQTCALPIYGICDSEDDDTTGLGLIVDLVTGNPAVMLLLVAIIVGFVVVQMYCRKEDSDIDLTGVEELFED